MDWQNRIARDAIEDPEQLLANPFNNKIHIQKQQDATTGLLKTVGWVQRILINEVTGHVVDGHMRIMLALKHNQPKVPVTYIHVDEHEERLLLAALDPIAAMVVYDRELTEQLLQQVNTDDAALQSLLSELAAENGIIPTLDYGNAHSGNGGESYAGDDDYAPLDSNIRMAQLFLTDANFDEFYALVKQLKEKFQRDNLTDAVLEAMRYAVHHR